MWFIADLIERYTAGVAKTFIKIAAREAEDNRRVLNEIAARHTRTDLKITQTAPVEAARPAAVVPPPAVINAANAAIANSAVQPIAEDAPTDQYVAKHALHVVQIDRQEGIEAKSSTTVAAAASGKAPKASAPVMPVGVRAAVVVYWLSNLQKADRRDMGDVLEKLRKDKKVRVPELQIIVSEVMGEPPQPRKKADHLAALRGHFLSAERGRTASPVEVQLAAN